MTAYRYPVILFCLVLGSMPLDDGRFGLIGGAAAQTPKNTLAAQIRTQGFVCDNALRATQDVKRSRPDHEVWILSCGNALAISAYA